MVMLILKSESKLREKQKLRIPDQNLGQNSAEK